MREIKTPRGTFKVPDTNFVRSDALKNGFGYYFTCDDGDIYIRHKENNSINAMLVKPYLAKSDVSDAVVKSVSQYLENHNLGKVEMVLRASNHPEDHYLYGVIASKNGTYSCWTCWNQDTKVMNFGHYGIKNVEDAINVLKEHYHDCSKEV